DLVEHPGQLGDRTGRCHGTDERGTGGLHGDVAELVLHELPGTSGRVRCKPADLLGHARTDVPAPGQRTCRSPVESSAPGRSPASSAPATAGGSLGARQLGADSRHDLTGCKNSKVWTSGHSWQQKADDTCS